MAKMAEAELKVSLSDQAYARLREQILECELAPGALISERGVAADLGMGISSVRSALARLTSDGLVLTIPRVGYQVTSFTIQYVNNFFEAWKIIGPAIVALAVPKMNGARAERMRSIGTRSIQDKEGNVRASEWIRQAEDEFDVLLEAADNPVLEDIYRRLQMDMHRLFMLVLSSIHASEIADGTTSTDFVNAKDPELAVRNFTEFIEGAHKFIMGAILESPALAQVALSFS